jgi:hypothetical protein
MKDETKSKVSFTSAFILALQQAVLTRAVSST